MAQGAPPAPMKLVQAGVGASQARLMADIQQSATGGALARQLEVLAWDAPVKFFPASSPAPGVVVDYLKHHFPSTLDSRPHWRAHRGNWRGAMRSTILAALGEPMGDHELRHVVAVMPLFLDARDLAATTQSLRQAIALEAHLGAETGFDAEIFRKSLRCWATAIWNSGGAGRGEVVSALMDGLRVAANERATARVFDRWNQAVPFSRWVLARPAQLESLLADRDRPLRQQLLALLLKNEPAARIATVRDRLAPALIESLRGDNPIDNRAAAIGLLSAHPAPLQPLLHQAFLASEDWRQKTSLAALLERSADAAVREDLMMFGYRLLASVPVENFPRENDDCWPGEAGQAIWASEMLARLGEPARAFLVDRLQDTIDPRQAALGIVTLAKGNRVPDRVWDERLMRLLAFGMDQGAPEAQRELCRASLKFAPAAVQELMREIAAQPANATQLVVRDAIRSRAEDHITAYNTLLREP